MSQSKATKLTVLGITLTCAVVLIVLEFVLEIVHIGAPFMLYLLFYLFAWLIAFLMERRLGNTRKAYIWSEALALLLPLAYVLLCNFL